MLNTLFAMFIINDIKMKHCNTLETSLYFGLTKFKSTVKDVSCEKVYCMVRNDNFYGYLFSVYSKYLLIKG